MGSYNGVRDAPSSKAVSPTPKRHPRLEFGRHQPDLSSPPIEVGLKVSAGKFAFVNQAQSLLTSMGGFALARLCKVIASILRMRSTTCTEFKL